MMKELVVLVLMLVVLPFFGFGQKSDAQRVLSNDSLIYYYQTHSEYQNGLDSVPMIKGELRFHQDFVIVDSLPPHCVLATFQNRNDSVWYEYFFESDELAFRLVELYEKGPVSIESWCRSGFKCADWSISDKPQLIKIFHCNGQLASEYTRHMFFLVGSYTRWHENGQKKSELHFDSKGNKHGEWQYFNFKGDLIQSEVYEHGKLLRTWND